MLPTAVSPSLGLNNGSRIGSSSFWDRLPNGKPQCWKRKAYNGRLENLPKAARAQSQVRQDQFPSKKAGALNEQKTLLIIDGAPVYISRARSRGLLHNRSAGEFNLPRRRAGKARLKVNTGAVDGWWRRKEIACHLVCTRFFATEWRSQS